MILAAELVRKNPDKLSAAEEAFIEYLNSLVISANSDGHLNVTAVIPRNCRGNVIAPKIRALGYKVFFPCPPTPAADHTINISWDSVA